MMLLRNRPVHDGWQTWFAWYPVMTSEGLVWLEKVKWRWVGAYDPYPDYERLDYVEPEGKPKS